MLIFRCKQQSEVEDFAKQDPYVIHKLVTSYSIREWNVVVGKV